MAIGDGFRTRAASLLRGSVSSAAQSHSQAPDPEKSCITPSVQHEEQSTSEKTHTGGWENNMKPSRPMSSGEKTLNSTGDNAVAQNKAAQRLVRTLPSE